MKTELLKNGQAVQMMEQADLHRLLPPRDDYAHKGDFGKVLLLCGAVGYTGAAVLAARAAQRCGSGLIYTLVPQAIYSILAVKLNEAMVFPVACDTEGRVALAAKEAIVSRLSSCTCALLGPGLGRSKELTQLLGGIVQSAACPLVLDADGLNAFAGHIYKLRSAHVPIILTPHDGEFARLMPDEPALPRADTALRCEAAIRLAQKSGAIVLLKGHRSIITDGTTVYVNCTGNPGMARGGSGDVLAGMLGALVGRGVPPREAAALGAGLGGSAGDLCAQELGQLGMLPGDMIMAAARLLRDR